MLIAEMRETCIKTSPLLSHTMVCTGIFAYIRVSGVEGYNTRLIMFNVYLLIMQRPFFVVQNYYICLTLVPAFLEYGLYRWKKLPNALIF